MQEPEVETINEAEIKQPYPVGKSNLSKRKNLHYELIENTNTETSFILKNKWYEFSFETPFYCQKIQINSNNKEISGLTIRIVDLLGSEKEIKISNKTHQNIYITINSTISSFKIKAPLRILEKISLSSLEVIGYTEHDLKEIDTKVKTYLTIIESIKKISDDLETKKAESTKLIQANEVKITELTLQKSALESDAVTTALQIAESKKELERLINELTISKTSLQSTNSTLATTNNNIEQLQQESKVLNEEISTSRIELSKLLDNKNLFAYEVEEYVKQGNRNISSYTILAFLPWMLIAYVTWYLFNGAVELTKITNTSQNLDVIDIIITRLPFTIIAGAVIIVSYEISKIFVSKIIEINAQKLRLSELGIIAKDTSYASATELDLDDRDIFEVRNKLKMDLLRHHLKNLAPEKFEYNINPSIWEKYKLLITRSVSNPEKPSE